MYLPFNIWQVNIQEKTSNIPRKIYTKYRMVLAMSTPGNHVHYISQTMAWLP